MMTMSISLGPLLLRFRQTFEHGILTAYYRDIWRSRILQTRPIYDTVDDKCEIHVLTSSSDFLNLIWGLKSFYFFSNKRYKLCIHGDKTLLSSHQEILNYHFPNANIITWSAAESDILKWLQDYPKCKELRKTRFISVKEFDFFYYACSNRLLLFDSDILFFSNPIELISRIENPLYKLNSVNRDIETAYSLDPEYLTSRIGTSVITHFNSGLGLIHHSSVCLKWLEEFLEIPGILNHPWRFEQTLMALCSSRYGVELLPSEYDVRLDRGLNGCPSRHYVGAIRHLMYKEGIHHLSKQSFLKNLMV